MRTLYDDWLVRRQRLDDPVRIPFAADQLRVLDFLLARYEEDPVAKEPARAPLNTGLILNSRALIVHHHISSHLNHAVIRNKEDAQRRIARCLSRIGEIDARSSVGIPEGNVNPFWGVTFNINIELTDTFPLDIACPTWGGRFLKACRIALAGQRALPAYVISTLISEKPLFKRKFFDNAEALDVLARCDCPLVHDYFLRGCFSDKCSKRFMVYAEEFFVRYKARAAFSIREALTDPSVKMRMRAAGMLARCGDLQDIALLQDLLTLDNSQEERDAYMAAMKRLAGLDVEAVCPVPV